MKIAEKGVRIRGLFWRMVAPHWMGQPLSGDGAARHGGRFNSKGTPALYMSETFATAVSEYEQDLGIRPGALIAYAVDAARIVDLSDEHTRRRLGVDLDTLRSPWKSVALVGGGTPLTWKLADRLIALGMNGARVPSARGPGHNLVLYHLGTARGVRVEALDPLGDLAARRPGAKRRRR